MSLRGRLAERGLGSEVLASTSAVDAELRDADGDATVPERVHLVGRPACADRYERLRAVVQQDAGPAERR